jgi:cation diffusion facilitator family transporter
MKSDTIATTEAAEGSSPDPHSFNYQKEQILKKANKAVYAALIANLAIFSIKLFFGIIGRSSALLSEAIHSLADAFNSFCLIIGLARCKRPPDALHPFGYGLEANVWTLMACLLMFLGACLSLYWGFERLLVHHDVTDLYEHFDYIIIALVLSLGFEFWAVNNASKAVLIEINIITRNPFKAFWISMKNMHKVKSPTTRFVWFEETAATLGVMVALVAVTMARFFFPEEIAYVPDGIASLIIGLILLSLAIYLFSNYLITLGAAAKPQVEKVIKDTTLAINGITEVCDLKTMDLGVSGLIVNMEVEVDPETQVRDVDDITQKIEDKLRCKLPIISHVNIEVQAYEFEENWSERFEALIEEGIEKDVINRREARILLNTYEFTDTTVDEVMVPRTEMDCLDINDSISELINLVVETGHTRIPVYDENIDNIVGLVHSKDVFPLFQNGNADREIKLRDLTRELPIVPENKPVSKLLHEFISNKFQMALVADEHGGIAGLVTVEDLLEEIFGEIWDEYDIEKVAIKRVDKSTVLLASRVDIEEINDRYNLDISDEEFQTIGGFIFGQLGRVPVVGDEVCVEDVVFTVEMMDGHKIELIRLYRQDGLFDALEEEERKVREEEEEENNHNGNG